MLRFRLLTLTSLLLVSLTAVCAAPEALLYGGSGTTIDGVAAFNGTRVFVRSMLHTQKGQFTELLLPGSSIRLLESSGSRYLGDAMDLLEGGVTLKTASGFAVHCSCMTASPRLDSSARYTVQMQEKTVYVNVYEGQVAVRALKNVSVASGKTVAVFCGSAKQEIVFAGKNLPAKVVMGTAAAATPSALIPQAGSKQDMSTENPTN